MRAIKISEINRYINTVLKTEPVLSNLCIVGEVANVNYHSSGYIFLTLKDEKSVLKCFIAPNVAKNLEVRPEIGKTIEVTGAISVYEKGGYYSLNIFTILKEEQGELASAFERLKQKLEKEGLFDSSRKRKLPKYPKKIAIVTSETGAAIEDIVKTARLRNRGVKLVLCPALVQGSNAAEDIVKSINAVNEQICDAEILIVGRGGGDKEDLAAFNEEIVARAIANSKIPVISAVGHEIDFTIADFVADVRAATPTAAAQIAVPDSEEMKKYLKLLRNEIVQEVKRKFKNARILLDAMKEQLEILNPASIIQRGYGAILDQNGRFISSAEALNIGDKLSIIMREAKLSVNVEAIDKEELNGR